MRKLYISIFVLLQLSVTIFLPSCKTGPNGRDLKGNVVGLTDDGLIKFIAENKTYKLRLWGVSIPIQEPWKGRAHAIIERRLPPETTSVHVEIKSKGENGIYFAIIKVPYVSVIGVEGKVIREYGWSSLNQSVLDGGAAWHNPRQVVPGYRDAQMNAKKEGFGLWKDPEFSKIGK